MLETERPSVRGWAALEDPRRCSLPLHCEAARRAAFAILGGRSSTDGCLVVTRGDRRAEASVARLLLGEGLRDSFWPSLLDVQSIHDARIEVTDAIAELELFARANPLEHANHESALVGQDKLHRALVGKPHEE